MKKAIILIACLTLLPIPTTAKENSPQTCEIEPAQPETGEYSPQQLQILASQNTVRIIGESNGGSGTLIAKQGNTYLVVANAHVIRGVNNIQLQTTDKKTHTAKLIPNRNLENLDLALLEFQTSQNYCLRKIADFIPYKQTPVIAAGYSSEKREIVYRTGTVEQIPDRPLKEGYQIGYTSDIEQGMSGGAIINSRGELIGINGKSTYPLFNTGYTYADETKPTEAEIQQMRTVSWGIPVSTFLARVDQAILTAYSLPLPNVRDRLPQPQLTGWLGELEQKAKQFTVKIQNKSGGNGSGVIIAKQGNTYTVLTSAHVFSAPDDANKICNNCNYEIVAVDGKTYQVDNNTIKVEIGVDLAVVKFTASQENYQVATLANYNPNDNDYMFTAGYPKLGNSSPWGLTMGRIFEKERGLIQTRQSDFKSENVSGLQTASSLTGGYELVYSSITYGGMSGGPLLDSLGRVIGIHGRAEGEQAFDEKTGDSGQVQLGYSLGIPISTFLGLATRLGVQAQKVETTIARLNNQQIKSIQSAILSTDISTGNTTASQWIERGNQLWRLRRYPEAVAAFDKAIEQKPSFVYLAYYGKGLALGTDGKSQEAIAALKSATELKPDFMAAWVTQSVAYRTLNQFEQALVAIEKAIQLQPNNPNLYNEQYVVLNSLKRYAEAEKAINKAISFNPRFTFYYNRGNFYSEQKKWELALADFNKAIVINPESDAAYNNRGNFYSEQKKWELALADFNKAIVINPESDKAYNNRGILYSGQKKWELALADFNKAIIINPESDTAYYNRGTLYYGQKKWELALADFNKAIIINPELAEAYNNRGILYKQQNKSDLALADYNKAIAINPQFAQAYNSRGSFYKQQKKWELALADYNKAIAINPESDTAYFNRGLLYSDLKKWELALADYNKAIAINPEWDTAYFNRGNLYSDLKKWDLALTDFTKAIQINPEYAGAYSNRGLLYKEQKEWELALADFNQAIQINPQLAEAYYNRGTLQKKRELALADFNQAIQINPQLADPYMNRGNLYREQKQWELALVDFTKAIEINPQLALAYLVRGFLYYEQNQQKLALVDFTKAIEINPQLALAYSNRGLLYKEQQKWELALADFTKAIEINSEDASAYINRGEIYKEQKKWELALDDFNQAIQINLEDARTYLNRAIVYINMGNKQKAIENLQQAARIFKDQGKTVAYKEVMDLLKQLER